MTSTLDLKTVFDGLGHGVLLFDSGGRLLLDNLAARTLLGKDINLIRSSGWEAAAALFNTRQTNPDEMIDAVRDRALQSERPVRFYIYLAGQYTPCWAASIQDERGHVNLMLTLDMVDWSAPRILLDKFRDEMLDAIRSTQGHVDLITQTINHHKTPETEDLSRRITGFTRLIGIHMDRVDRLMGLLERLEAIRTGEIKDIIRARLRTIDLSNFLEDFVEELDEITLVDPETEAGDHRSRITVNLADGLVLDTSTYHLTRILRDVLRNAIMYSMKATPVEIKVQPKGDMVQFDISDEGYGIREREHDRVFQVFQRARQPQIIAEFGYGVSLHICKHEVEAMNGRMWFQSEEGVGTTFSFMLPKSLKSVSSLSTAPSTR